MVGGGPPPRCTDHCTKVHCYERALCVIDSQFFLYSLKDTANFTFFKVGGTKQ